MTDEIKARLEDIDRRIVENEPVLRERAVRGVDEAILASAAKYRDVLEKLAKE